MQPTGAAGTAQRHGRLRWHYAVHVVHGTSQRALPRYQPAPEAGFTFVSSLDDELA